MENDNGEDKEDDSLSLSSSKDSTSNAVNDKKTFVYLVRPLPVD